MFAFMYLNYQFIKTLLAGAIIFIARMAPLWRLSIFLLRVHNLWLNRDASINIRVSLYESNQGLSCDNTGVGGTKTLFIDFSIWDILFEHFLYVAGDAAG